MILLSDSLPGSGQVYGGLVDKDVNFDSYGLPYIPGKRIKGILKESAHNLKDVEFLKANVDDIFGSDFRLSNGYLEGYEKYLQFFKAISRVDSVILRELFNFQKVVNYFTYTRSQTSTEYPSGVAKKHSLRMMRVLQKGLVFNFDISFTNQYFEDMDNVLKVTREFGTNRTRGLGHIKLEIDQESTSSLKSSVDVTKEVGDSNKLRILPLILRNVEQLLVSNQLGNHGTTDYFIPGSTVLGAIAAKFIRYTAKHDESFDSKSAHDNTIFRNLFLNNIVIFTNFYPSDVNNTYYPVPASLVKKKNSEEFLDLSFIKDRPEDDDLVKLHGLISLDPVGDELNIRFPNISKSVEYHHARPEDRSMGHAMENYGQFFQYETLNPGQRFKGYIIGQESHLKEIVKILNSENSSLILGKSRSAQYGKCNLEVGEVKEFVHNENNIVESDGLLISSQSDVILRNNFGFPIPDTKHLLKEIVGDNLINSESTKFLKFKIVGGYNNVWNLPKPQYYALAAGSEILVKTSNSDKQLPRDFKKQFFGENTSQGYGQIAINGHNHKIISKKDPDSEPAELPQDLMMLAEFIKFCLKERLKERIKERALSTTIKIPQAATPSFVNRIKLLINRYDNFADLEEILKSIVKGEYNTKDGSTRKIPNEFREKFQSLSSYIKFNTTKYNFDDFDDLIKNSLEFSKDTTLDNLIMPSVKNKIAFDFYKEDKFELFQMYCEIVLNSILMEKKEKEKRKGIEKVRGDASQ